MRTPADLAGSRVFPSSPGGSAIHAFSPESLSGWPDVSTDDR